MTPTLHYVVYAAVLTFVSLLMGSFFRNRLWTWPGLMVGFGNRHNIPPPSALAGRTDRAAMNTLENFVLFAVLALIAHVAAVDSAQVLLGAKIFFWARVGYLAAYVIGIPYLRSAIWAVGVIGMGMIAAALF